MADPVETPQDPSKIIEQVAGVQKEIKLETGQVYKGANEDELLKELAKAQEHSTRHIKEQKDELERVRTELQQVRSALPPPPRTDDNTYNPEKYFELWKDDPLKAHQYANQFDPEAQRVKSVIANQAQRSEIETFKDSVGFHPEQNPQAADVFSREFVKTGLQPTANNMELVYYRLVNNGTLQPQVTANVNPTPVPPQLGGNGTAQGGGFDMTTFYNLPPQKQAEVIEKMKAAGYK